MEQKEMTLANRIYQDATVGMLAIDKILKKIENETLRKLFIKQYDMYEKFANKCDAFAINNDFEIKENSFFKKTKQTAMLYWPPLFRIGKPVTSTATTGWGGL